MSYLFALDPHARAARIADARERISKAQAKRDAKKADRKADAKREAKRDARRGKS